LHWIRKQAHSPRIVTAVTFAAGVRRDAGAIFIGVRGIDMAASVLGQRDDPLRRSDGARLAVRFWNPYVAGLLLGLLLLTTYAVSGRGLGATAAFSATAAWIAGMFSPEHVQANIVHSRYWNDGSPFASWTVFLLLGAFVGAFVSALHGRRLRLSIERGPHVSANTRLALAFAGGFIAAYGARIARGCTSGQALTGGSILNVGSLVFMGAVFAAAYALAYFVRKEWL
jgi:hypothetical protein